MNSVTNRYSGRQVPSLTRCDPKPEKCSTCGMLECLCRPRFFAGQVLTADDLNRLKHYVIAKNRLHNRQLHGWGVVNGLEVTCDDCGPGVVVGCGYALSPCGDDIVVCEPVVVDVCTLIKACREAERRCEPPRRPSPAGCDQGDTEWVLAIRYTESPAKGVKPLMRAETPGCGCTSSGCTCGHHDVARSRCGCGGSTSGRCDCKDGASRPKPRTAPVQCEPTIICEGFAFDVYKKPPEPDPDPDRRDGRIRLNPDSELSRRFECCVDLLWNRIPKMPGQPTPQNLQSNPATWQRWTCTFKDYLQRYLSRQPGYNCELLTRLNQIVCPPLNSPNLAALLAQTMVTLWFVWLDAVLACFCSALLPPCPEPYPNDCVPLATVRVSASPCRVLSVCNWTVHRKFATTFPALQYWLSILPFGAELRRMLDRICCMQISVPEFSDDARTNVPGAAAGAGAPAPEAAGTDGGDFGSTRGAAYERASSRMNPQPDNPDRLNAASRIALDAFARGATPIDPQQFVESAFLHDRDKADGHLSAAELDNLPQFLALNQLLRPMAVGLMQGDALAALSVMGLRGSAPAAEPEAGPDVARLRKEIDDLRSDLERQAEEIRRLKRPRKRKG